MSSSAEINQSWHDVFAHHSLIGASAWSGSSRHRAEGAFPAQNALPIFFSGVSCSDGGAEYVIIVDYWIWLERKVRIPGSRKLGQCGFADSRSVEMVKKLLNDGGLR